MNGIYELNEQGSSKQFQADYHGTSEDISTVTRSIYSSKLYQISKRSLDICGALIGLLFLIYLLPIISLLIFWEDRGPIFYEQKRMGLHGKSFTTYKLRSMVSDADIVLKQRSELLTAWQKNGKLQNDPRITRIGHFLRKTSLDELPQMLNVLKGDMSLVGPRAVQTTEASIFGELGELRQIVKPGVTGLWQISGRSQTSYEQRCLLDCTYVLERSLLTDIDILLKTIPAVINGEGAY